MITVDDCGETHCTYSTCSREFCEGEICYAGLYQCPHISERAKAWLPVCIEDLEDFKRSDRDDAEYHHEINRLEEQIKRYKELAEGKNTTFTPFLGGIKGE